MKAQRYNIQICVSILSLTKINNRKMIMKIHLQNGISWQRKHHHKEDIEIDFRFATQVENKRRISKYIGNMMLSH
ncbi:MAG: hypothetical protein ACI90V_003747 [Bacillariaceae sp.]|jgi:hypothetical protein